MIERLSISASAIAVGRPTRVSKECPLFSEASREFLLVAHCCDPQTAAGSWQDVLSIPDGLCWDQVLQLTKRHRVTGLVHAALCRNEFVPLHVRAALAKGANAIAMANMHALSALRQVDFAFRVAEIPFMVLKGLPVGQLAYGSATVRHSKDVDLLVAPEFVDKADELLLSLGFCRSAGSGGLSAKQETLWRRFRKHHDYVNTRSGVHLEVHWRRSDNIHLSAPVDAPAGVVDFGGLALHVASESDMLLDLCMHGASHAWFRLKWVADVAALLARSPTNAGPKLLEFAKLHDLDRPVEQGLLLCAALFPDLQQAKTVEPTQTGKRLARIASGALLEKTTAAASAETDFVAHGLKRSRFLLRRSWRYRLEEARVQAASPADWNMLAIPGRVHFLYLLLRLPLWMKRRWFPRKNLSKVALHRVENPEQTGMARRTKGCEL